MGDVDHYALLAAIRMGDEIADNMRKQAAEALDGLKSDLLCDVRWQYAHTRTLDIYQWLLFGSQWKRMAESLRRRLPDSATTPDKEPGDA